MRGLLVSWMGASHQKDQAMIRSLEVLAHPHSPEKGEEPEVELIIAHAYDENSVKTPKIQGLESFQAGEHIYVPRGWCTPTSQSSTLRILLDLTLCVSSFAFIYIL